MYTCFDAINYLMPFFPEHAAKRISAQKGLGELEELRVRAQKPVQLVFSQGDALVDMMSESECVRLLEALCDYSVYARDEELKRGYITLENGIRVGVSGRVAARGGKIDNLTHVTSFNIRIVREKRGCATHAVPLLLSAHARAVSTLIVSPPGAGKTTLLRDIARCLSDGECGATPHKVCILDERGEIAGCRNGVPSLDVGQRTDVMDACPKAEGISMLVRSMSPDVVVTDEIGGSGDAAALMDAARCGVSVIASAHADGLKDALSRPRIAYLIENGGFKRLIAMQRDGSRLSFTQLLAPFPREKAGASACAAL